MVIGWTVVLGWTLVVLGWTAIFCRFLRFWLKKCLVVLVGLPPTAIFLTYNFANSLEISNFTFAVGRLYCCTQK